MSEPRDAPMLDVRDLHRSYASGPRRIEVLAGLELEVAAGETVAVVGDSGVGKSTLLHLLGGLDRPDRGSIRFRGAELVGADAARLAAHRNRHVGFVFQFHHLLPEFTALENVEMPFRIGGIGERLADARSLLERLGLAERLHHVPAELSGGEQQRVALARALATGPSLVLADEPTGNLDPATGKGVFELMRELQKERGFSMVIATHSGQLARGCGRIMQLDAGRLRALDERQTRAYFEALGAGPGADPMI